VSLPVAVFASGSGSNLQALLDHEEAPASYRVHLVVSDRPEAGALERARRAQRRAEVVPVAGRTPEAVADDLLALLEEEGIRAIFLAGYLRLVPEAVVKAFRGRILNIHPALLPSFGGQGMYGIRIHREVLRAGCTVTGVTIHHVDERYDTGKVFAQWPVPVRPDDTPEGLAARVLQVEHVLYPLAADHLCRALGGEGEPAAFAAPGRGFLLGAEEAGEETARQIREAFREASETAIGTDAGTSLGGGDDGGASGGVASR